MTNLIARHVLAVCLTHLGLIYLCRERVVKGEGEGGIPIPSFYPLWHQHLCTLYIAIDPTREKGLKPIVYTLNFLTTDVTFSDKVRLFTKAKRRKRDSAEQKKREDFRERGFLLILFS